MSYYYEHDFKPGRQLVRVEHYRDGEIRSIQRVKIDKVYRTGKIVTDYEFDRSGSGGKYQYGWDGECFVQTRRTSSYTHGVYLYPLKAEKKWLKRMHEEQSQKRALQVQRYLSEQLSQRRWLVATPDQLARINAILNED